MKPKTLFAIGLILLGIAVFAYEGITYTSRDKAFDIGPVHVTTEKTHHIPLSPIAGAVALVAGISLLLLDGKRLGRAGA